jgi:D-alanine-D-alanine ligase
MSAGARKIRVAVIFGGRSAEHEVSLQSARSIVDAMDRARFDVVLIGIDKQGGWHRYREGEYLLNPDDPVRIALRPATTELAVVPGRGRRGMVEVGQGGATGRAGEDGPVDVVFPVLHGPFGEDGTVQGYLKLAGVPFVGPGVLGSAVGMDKDVTNRLLRDAGIPKAAFRAFRSHERGRVSFASLERELGMPVFVKPANLGSSVGISKVGTEAELGRALDLAFRYDTKVVVEQNIPGREIECAVLGNETPEASVPGEVVPDEKHGFYSYEAKYLDEHGARLDIPARLDAETVRRVQELACRAFVVLACEGMARVDFFLTPAGELYVNEINTIPGFTRISMYPKLWEASGLPYPRLIERLIDLALERHERDAALETSARREP